MDRSFERFILASHGWSATNWVASALDLHPAITCVHGALWSRIPDPSNIEYLKGELPRLRRGYVARETRSVLDVYGEFEPSRKPAARFVGSVHTFRLRDLPLQERTFPGARVAWRTMNLVRHPLDLVVSGYGQFRDLFRIDLNEFAWTATKIVRTGLDLVEEICAKHDLEPGAYESLCFFGACAALVGLKADLDAMDALAARADDAWGFQGTVRMEDVTRIPSSFEAMVRDLTGDADLANPPYLDEVFRSRRLNAHSSSISTDTAAKWDALEPWKQAGFRAFFERFELRSPYEKFGYDFAFLD